MRGRKPTPERLRLLQEGTQRVIGGDTPPTMPEWLTGEAAKEWERVVSELRKLYVITPLDAMTLAAYCRAYVLFRKYDEVLEAEGPMTVDATGNVRAHPAGKMCIQMFGELRRMAAEFGFSPAARSRIDAPVPTDPEDEDFDAFGAGQAG